MIKVTSGWDGGFSVKFCKDGNYLMLGGINATQIAQLKIWDNNWSAGYTFAYKLTYIKSGDVCAKVRIDMWYGVQGGTLNKVEAHSISNEKLTYDETEKCFYVKYDLVEETQFAPDATIVSLSAFTDKDVDCNWTVSAEVLAKDPNA